MSKFLIYAVEDNTWWRKNPSGPETITTTDIREATQYDNTNPIDMKIMDNAAAWSTERNRIMPFTNYKQAEKEAKKHRLEYIQETLDDFKSKKIADLQQELAELQHTPILTKFDVLKI